MTLRLYFLSRIKWSPLVKKTPQKTKAVGEKGRKNKLSYLSTTTSAAFSSVFSILSNLLSSRSFLISCLLLQLFFAFWSSFQALVKPGFGFLGFFVLLCIVSSVQCCFFHILSCFLSLLLLGFLLFRTLFFLPLPLILLLVLLLKCPFPFFC